MTKTYMAVERRLTELVGPVGGKVHTARNRNDRGFALDLQLYRAAVRGHLERILEVMEVLLRRATELKDTVMPGYTHLQRAQPVTVGYHLLAYVFMLSRDARQRFIRWFRLFVDAAGSGGAGWSELPRGPCGGSTGVGIRAWRQMLWMRWPRDAAYDTWRSRPVAH